MQGDFGLSMKNKIPVIEVIGLRFWPTVLLTVFAMLWSTAFGLLIGVLLGRSPRSLARLRRHDSGRVRYFVSRLLARAVDDRSVLGALALAADRRLRKLEELRHAVLRPGSRRRCGHGAVHPLGVPRKSRREDYIRTARAKGVQERFVVWKHVLRNALIPVITMVGLQFGFLLGGSIVVETVFSWPGLGRLLVDSVSYRDYPVIQAEILLFSVEFILINLVVDLLYAAANPEIRYK